MIRALSILFGQSGLMRRRPLPAPLLTDQTYRIRVEANEAIVVASLLCLFSFIHTNGCRVEEAQRGNAMNDVAAVTTVVLLIVVRARELVWTGGISQKREVCQAGQL